MSTRWGKTVQGVYSCEYTKQIILVLFMIYCIIFHSNNSKPTFAHPVFTCEVGYQGKEGIVFVR